jgi:hypothetical protein
VRDHTAARNLTVLRKVALTLLAGDRSGQTSLRGRRRKAAWNDDYMLRIIARQTHAGTLPGEGMSPNARSGAEVWTEPVET